MTFEVYEDKGLRRLIILHEDHFEIIGAPVSAYDNDTEEDYISRVYFYRTQTSHKAAYRIARLVAQCTPRLIAILEHRDTALCKRVEISYSQRHSISRRRNRNPTREGRVMDLMTDKQMDELPVISQAAAAIGCTLEQIHTHPTIGYFLGFGGQTFALLTEAFATMSNTPVEKIREEFMPVAPKKPEVAEEDDENDEICEYRPSFSAEHEDLRDALELLVEQFAITHLIPNPWAADDKQLIDALRAKLEGRAA